MAVVDAEEIALAVVGIFNDAVIGQGFSYQASGMVALITRHPLTTIVAVFGLFLQVAVKVVNVSGALPIKPDFLLDQAVGVVVQPVGLADFVFNFGEQ